MNLSTLLIPYRVSTKIQDIPLDVHPKGQYEINNEWGTHSKKRNIDKPGADP